MTRNALLMSLCVLAPGVYGQVPASDPQALVQSFYDAYPNELEGGLPRGEDLLWISRFVSERLHARFRSALAYQEDWIRRNPDRPPVYLKPPFADGIDFTGVPDAISAFKVLRAERRADGVWYVPIRFWIDLLDWEAVVLVKEERGQFVIDDIVFLPREPGDETWCLSDSLEWRSSE